jgi:hypothetical protein
MSAPASDTAVGKVLFSLITANAAITAIVGTKVYPLLAAQGALMPYIVYKKVSNVFNDTKSGQGDINQYRMQVDVYTTSYAQGLEVQQLLRETLDRVTRGTVAGSFVDGIKILSEDDMHLEDPAVLLFSQDYQIRILR